MPSLHTQVSKLQHQNAQLTQTIDSLEQEREVARDEATQAAATLAERDAQLTNAETGRC
jgi:outer membrane murein-binding lipoprotein Lpp